MGSGIKKYKYFMVLYNIFLFGIMVAPALTYINVNKISRYIFFSCMIMSVFFLMVILPYRKYISNSLAIQYLLVFILITVFMSASLFNQYTMSVNKIQYLYYTEWLLCVTGVVFWGTLVSWKNVVRHIIQYIKNNYLFFLFIFLYVIFSYETLHTWSSWDSREYYRYISNLKEFTFSPNDIALFKSAGHMSYGYMFFMAIGEFFAPSYGVGARFINLALLVFAIISFRSVLEHLLPLAKKGHLNFFAIILGLTPTVWGPLYEQNVEISILCFFIFFLHAYLKENKILTVFWGIMLVFTKETSVLLVGGFALGYIMSLFIKNKKISILFTKEVFKQILVFYIPCFLFLTYFIVDRSGWAGNLTVTTEKEINMIGFNKMYIIGKLKQLFLANFQWVITLAIVIGIFAIFFSGREKLKIKCDSIPIIVSYIMFLLGQMFYVTYLLPRYILLQYLFMILLFAYITTNIKITELRLSVFYSIVCVLLCMQTFFTCDPVTLAIFPKVKIGKGYMASANIILTYDEIHAVTGEDAYTMALSPYTQYNRQYLYKYKLMEKILSSINYSSNDVIVLPDMFHPISGGTYWGHVKVNYYDKKTNAIYQLFEPMPVNNDLIEINYIIQTEEEIFDFEQYENEYYIDFPYNEKFCSNKLIENYDAKYMFDVEYRMWMATVYKLK